MSTFNGWTIFTLPSSPAVPSAIEWQFGDMQGADRAGFGFQQQIFDWQQSILRASLSYQRMPNAQAQAWIAFLMSLRGINGVFSFGDPLNTAPQNPSAVAGSVSGSNQTGYSLVTTSSNLTPGDWFSLGLRLYRVTSVSGGTLGIWPNVRESPAGGTNLVIVNATGLFRLSKNDRSIRVDKSKTYDITFEIEEAL